MLLQNLYTSKNIYIEKFLSFVHAKIEKSENNSDYFYNKYGKETEILVLFSMKLIIKFIRHSNTDEYRLYKMNLVKDIVTKDDFLMNIFAKKECINNYTLTQVTKRGLLDIDKSAIIMIF